VLMWRYLTLLSIRSLQEIESLRRDVEDGRNPRDVKLDLARELVTRFHGEAAAVRTSEGFTRQFRDRVIPEDVPRVTISTSDGRVTVAHALKTAGLASSTSQAMRLIQQGGVRLDGVRVDAREALIEFSGIEVLLQVGRRRFARVRVEVMQ